MVQSKLLIILIVCLQITYQENQNLVFFDSPMIWTKYVILTDPNYQGNNIYTYNVPIDTDNGTSYIPNLTSIKTGVSLAGFTSLVSQNFRFRMNEFFPTGIISYLTLNWTVLSPSSFNYLSFTVIILQQNDLYLELFKSSYVNLAGLYDSGSPQIVLSQQTKYNLTNDDKIYNFITSFQNFQNKPLNYWTGPCMLANGSLSTCTWSGWDWQDARAYSGVSDDTHLWVKYSSGFYTYLFQIYSIHIVFHKSQYDSEHLYPYILDYKNDFVLGTNLIPANMNKRYGPDYNPKCVLGHDVFYFGRFSPSLKFEVTSSNFQSRIFYQGASYLQTDIDSLCLTGFYCDANSNNTTNSTYQPNSNNNFYFPSYINCLTCPPDNIDVSNCSQVAYCTSCVLGYIPGKTCYYCLTCNNYAYILEGYCQSCNMTFEGCLTCTTNAHPSCTQCTHQYFLNASLCYLCNTTMIFCVLCNSSTICTQCSSDGTYYLNLTSNKCTLCSSTISHCQKCINNTDCISCFTYFYVDPTTLTCKPCNTTDKYCATCINQTFCLTCDVNYNLDVNGTCQFCDFYTSNCTQCTNDTTCTNCSLSYFLDYQNQCKVCSQFITGCYLCDNNQTCQDCYEDYVLKTDELCYYCALFIDKCFKCKNETFCTNCVYGYYVNDNHTCTDCDIPMNHCVDCVVSDLCLDCSYGFYPNASECLLCKSQMTECIDCVNSTFCLVCTSDFIPINGTCQCRHGYLVTEMCNIILGCVSNHNISGVKRCLACNAAANFSYSNFNCSCKEGYQISGVWQDAVCVEKCGDGRHIYLACDDGNLFDGDGCSSKCMIEPGYYCQNGSFWSVSVCELIVEFSVSLYSIKRDDSANSGVIKLQISPVKSQLKGAQWTNYITVSISEPKPSTASPSQPSKLQTHLPARLLNTPVSIKITDITYNQGIVSINFDYFESVQNFDVQVEIQFDPSLFKASSKSLSFPMKSMNIPLTYEGYLNLHQVLIILFYVIASLGLLQFLICLKTKNLVGVQTLQVLQFFFFVKLLTDDINPSLLYMNYPCFMQTDSTLSYQTRDEITICRWEWPD